MSVPFAAFGPGILIASRTDTTVPAPINIGYAQEFSLELSGTTKQLYGQNQWPLAAARSTIKATGKFKAAAISGIAFNNCMFGGTMSTGGISWNVGSTYTLSTASTTAVQIGSSLTFDADLGITYAASGLPLQRVSTGLEAAGKYSITSTSTGGGAGLYNFSVADTTGQSTGQAIKVTYTNTTASGQSLILANALIGTTPTFQLDYYTNLNQPTSKPFAIRLFAAVASKLALAFKLEDFVYPEIDFDLFANNSGNVFDFVYPEVS